jgi:hypothetical protein
MATPEGMHDVNALISFDNCSDDHARSESIAWDERDFLE